MYLFTIDINYTKLKYLHFAYIDLFRSQLSLFIWCITAYGGIVKTTI